jgi:hypothetical protein
LLELQLERSTREERDVGRLVRLNELLDRYPGNDRVILRILGLHGREATAIELAEHVQCCADLVEGMIRELGEEAVRVRAAPPPEAGSPPVNGAAPESAPAPEEVAAGV